MSIESFRGENLTKREIELSPEEKAFIEECADSLTDVKCYQDKADSISARIRGEEKKPYNRIDLREVSDRKHDLEAKRWYANDDLRNAERSIADKLSMIPRDKRLFLMTKAKEAYLAKIQLIYREKAEMDYKKIDEKEALDEETHAKEIFNRIFKLANDLERKDADTKK